MEKMQIVKLNAKSKLASKGLKFAVYLLQMVQTTLCKLQSYA
jgi:hypothetical protein